MNDDEFRDLCAALALISRAWVPQTHEEHAKNCYDIAESMIKEKARRKQEEDGIAGVIKKRKSKEA
jgi:hypothetical protein